MSKFSNKRVPLGETKVFAGFRLYQSEIDAVKEVHDNFSEWVRDAVLQKLDREKKQTEEAIKKIKRTKAVRELSELSTDNTEFAVNKFGELVADIKNTDPELFQEMVIDGLITENKAQ